MTDHIGYAGRTREKFRFEGDPNEVVLRVSKEAAADILAAYLCLLPIAQTPLHGLRAIARALEELGISPGEA